MSQSPGYAKTLAAAYNPGMCLLALSVILCRYQDRKIKDVRGSDMEKVKFAFADGNGEDEFFILEEQRSTGARIFLLRSRRMTMRNV